MRTGLVVGYVLWAACIAMRPLLADGGPIFPDLGVFGQLGAVGVLAWVAWMQLAEIREMRKERTETINSLFARQHIDSEALAKSLCVLSAQCAQHQQQDRDQVPSTRTV